MFELFLQGGVEGDLQEILDEERDKIERNHDLAPASDDHEHIYLQDAYQQYLESVEDDDDDR